MEIGQLYQFILLIVVSAMLLGVGIVALDKFGGSGGIGATASEAINDSRDALTPIATTWIPLIVTIGCLAIVLTLVIKSFGQQR